MKRILAAIAFVLMTGSMALALQGQQSGGPSDGSNLVGPIGKVNTLADVGSGGTASCDMSLGPVCAFAVGAGAFTIAKPTNGAIKTMYWLEILPTADVTGTYASGWLQMNAGAALALPTATNSGPVNTVSLVPFFFDGTNYQIWNQMDVYGRRGTFTALSGSLVGAVSNTSQTIVTTTGNHTTTTGQFIASAGGTFQVTPVALATLTACAGGTEGSMGTENNSTGACSAGATATSAGSTHCQVYCNGTNWIQTGR